MVTGVINPASYVLGMTLVCGADRYLACGGVELGVGVGASDHGEDTGLTAGAGRRRRMTINDVARLADVSKKTVSRVINQSPLVNAETRERVQKVIAELDYAPDPQARGLSFGRSFLIGLVYDNPNPQYVVNMQLGLLDGLRGSGFELVVHPCRRDDPRFLDELRSFMERHRLFGVVLTPSISEDERAAHLMSEAGCAYVRIASVPLDSPTRMIVTHDRLGGLAAARHLMSLGHRRVAVIAGPPTFRSSYERRAGFEEGLAEVGVKLDPAYALEGAYTFDSAIPLGIQLLTMSTRPSAIFAFNDEMAVGVLQAARLKGLNVPQDLSVVGFDDFQIASRVWPTLTTVRTPTREIGRLAAAQILGRGASKEIDPDDRLPSLIVRESSAPPTA
jgi:LacI family transcriptional regulator